MHIRPCSSKSSCPGVMSPRVVHPTGVGTSVLLTSDTQYAESWQETANGWVFRASLDVWLHLWHSLSETSMVIFVVVIFFCSFPSCAFLFSVQRALVLASWRPSRSTGSTNKETGGPQRDGRPPLRRRTARLWLLLVILAGGCAVRPVPPASWSSIVRVRSVVMTSQSA